MDVLKDEFFDDYADDRNGGKRTAPAPNGGNDQGNQGNPNNNQSGNQRADSNGRPFPDEDYNKNGKLRKVRGRVLKKLLKYEFKAYLNPMLIMIGALFALAIGLCVLGCFLTPEDFEMDSRADGRIIAWIIALVIFIWVALASIFFPLGFSWKHYHKQFFTSQGYLTLSIPASPEEHILAKRIASMVAMAVGAVAAFLAVIIAFLPLFGLMFAPTPTPPSEPSTSAVSGWEVLYVVLEILLSPLLLESACCAFTCWRHRGLKKWMIVLLVAGMYFLSTVISVVLAGAVVKIPPQVWEFLMEAGKWIFFVLKCVALYLLFLYETQTLRKKINLK